MRSQKSSSNSGKNRSVVLVYKDRLLPGSQTFVRGQGECLARFQACYVGARKVHDGLELPSDREFILNRGNLLGKVREFVFWHAGITTGLTRQLRRLRPVLIHAHFGPDGLSAMKLARRLDVPLIVSHHGYDVTTKPQFAVSYPHRRYVRQKQRLQQNAQLFLANSCFIRDQLVSQGFPEDRLRVHYIGIDTGVFHPRADVAREPVILFVGRLVENKGGSFLLQAMAKLRAQNPQARLVIIGEGALRKHLEEEAANIAPGAKFLGHQDQKVVREWMARASVLCVPSITSENGIAEAFGLVFIEAQAMGLPAVSFDCGGIPEAICDGITGFVVPERDIDSLSVRLHQLMTDSSMWQRFSEAGVERVRTQFDLRTQTGKLEGMYDQVIAAYREHCRVSARSSAVPAGQVGLN
jgi:colanic acid/amylovoran biosynthesis glycosyltransferase